MSPEASLPLLPVLSPIFQFFGKPARSRLSPVLQLTIHSLRCSREACDNASPSRKRRTLPAIAAGVVVSLGSPGGERLSSGLVVVEPRDRVSRRAPERGQGSRAPCPRQQQIGAGVVAEFDGRLAHVGDRHRANGEVLFGHRSVFEQVLRPIAHHRVQFFFAAIDPRQHEGRERGFEGAAHHETFVGAPRELRTGCDVFGMDADPPTGFALICSERRRRFFGKRGPTARPDAAASKVRRLRIMVTPEQRNL